MSATLTDHGRWLLPLLLFATACEGPEPQVDEKPLQEEVVPEQQGGVLNVSGRLIGVPSPAQTMLLLRSSGASYQKEIALPLDKAGNLTGRTAEALGLGMYGAGLAYATVFQDGGRVMATMKVVEGLADRLELGNAFAPELLDRFQGNVSDEDSLLRMSGEAFRAADQYLKNNQREDIAALVLAGGWIEGLHLIASDEATRANAQVAGRIAEQKRTLSDVIALVEAAEQDDLTKALSDGLAELSKVYEGITVHYVFEEPVTDAASKVTYINSTNKVEISAEQTAAIASIAADLRSAILRDHE